MPFYSHTNAKGSAPATATASVPYSYASGAAAPVVAEAFPVGALPQVTSTEVQKAHPSMSKMEQFVVVEVVVPAGAVPGSVLNVTLSDGRIVRKATYCGACMSFGIPFLPVAYFHVPQLIDYNHRLLWGCRRMYDQDRRSKSKSPLCSRDKHA